MPEVTVTQCIRPHGRRVDEFVEVSPELFEMAEKITDAGYHFFAEKVPGFIYFTVDNEGEDKSLGNDLVQPSADVVAAFTRLIETAYKHLQDPHYFDDEPDEEPEEDGDE